MTAETEPKSIRCSACLVAFPTFTDLGNHIKEVRGKDEAHPMPTADNGEMFSRSVLRRRAITNGESL